MRKCEFKKKYNPLKCKHEKSHIYGEGIFDTLANIITKETSKNASKKLASKAVNTGLNKVGTHIGNRSGDKIIELLQSKNNK